MRDHAPAESIDLGGAWALTDEFGAHSAEMTLPGDGITALHQAGILPAPYFARNEDACRWVAERDWTARRKFWIENRDCELVIDGLDTVAEVRVNGQPVASAANAFRTLRSDLAGVARCGENEIEILFRSATRAANAAQAAQPFRVPYHAGNCPIPNGNMLRKPQCDFGWDWNVALSPFGVTGGVRIETKGPRIEGVLVEQRHDEGIRLHVRIAATSAEGKLVGVECAGAHETAVVKDGAAAFELDVSVAELWWPRGLGPQTLHHLSVTMAGVTEVRRIGLRSAELIAGGEDGSFRMRVNDRDTFCRGANWIPADALSGRIRRESVRELLESAAAANMNMIRAWGGGRYEANWFYEICDELGLMVWQDFMFACHLYPSTPEFLADVEAEVRENVLRFNHHPSIVLWCGDNELVGGAAFRQLHHAGSGRATDPPSRHGPGRSAAHSPRPLRRDLQLKTQVNDDRAFLSAL